MMNKVDVSVIVSEVVASTLDLDSVTPDVNFFAIGGHSVAVLEVTARLQELLGLDIPPELLFECDSLERFTDAIRDFARLGGSSADTPRRTK